MKTKKSCKNKRITQVLVMKHKQKKKYTWYFEEWSVGHMWHTFITWQCLNDRRKWRLNFRGTRCLPVKNIYKLLMMFWTPDFLLSTDLGLLTVLFYFVFILFWTRKRRLSVSLKVIIIRRSTAWRSHDKPTPA